MGTRRMKWAAYLAGLFLVFHLAGFNYYVFFMNAANHTGLELRQDSYAVLIFGVVVGMFGLIRKQNEWVAVGIVAFILFANIYGFDQLGIMMPYEDWIQRGMPNR